VQCGARGSDLRQPALDHGVDVLVGFAEHKVTRVQLALDSPQTALDRLEVRGLQQAGCGQPAGVGDAAGDVIGIELEVDLERRRKPLELGQQPARETAAPELAGYGVSLLTSPSRPFSSRSCRRPWTSAAVRTPMPHSLMKPAAADWSKASPLP